ncbi:hypothetical protein GCM10009641_85010 [Mycobacterium cookii]|uniref:Lipoyl-binding domain-containing protein n=1 Tax=Nocardioides furvisabuli TaxID=375542 RepID=A0ABN2WWR0_9ACTN
MTGQGEEDVAGTPMVIDGSRARGLVDVNTQVRVALSLRSPVAGEVKRVQEVVGNQVPLGAPLFTVEARS